MNEKLLDIVKYGDEIYKVVDILDGLDPILSCGLVEFTDVKAPKNSKINELLLECVERRDVHSKGKVLHNKWKEAVLGLHRILDMLLQAGLHEVEISPKQLSEAEIQDRIDTAYAKLQTLDRDLADEFQFACGVRPIDGGMLTLVYNKCLGYATKHPPGVTRTLWNDILDILIDLSHVASKPRV